MNQITGPKALYSRPVNKRVSLLLRLDEALHQLFKLCALQQQTSVTNLIVEAMREKVKKKLKLNQTLRARLILLLRVQPSKTLPRPEVLRKFSITVKRLDREEVGGFISYRKTGPRKSDVLVGLGENEDLIE
jgi:hypothetical protein